MKVGDKVDFNFLILSHKAHEQYLQIEVNIRLIQRKYHWINQ